MIDDRPSHDENMATHWAAAHVGKSTGAEMIKRQWEADKGKVCILVRSFIAQFPSLINCVR